MRALNIALVVVLLAVAVPAGSQESTMPSGTYRLLGSWSADCSAWGTPARCTLAWSEGLHPSQIIIQYAIAAQSDGAAIFSGKGVYRVLSDNAFDGYWHDSGGAIHPLAASWDKGALTTYWGIAGSEQGRTRYRITDADQLEVTDWSLGESAWRQFMQVTYDRDD